MLYEDRDADGAAIKGICVAFSVIAVIVAIGCGIAFFAFHLSLREDSGFIAVATIAVCAFIFLCSLAGYFQVKNTA